MHKNIGIEGLGDLVERPYVATLATYRKNGDVLLTPVWHEWRDGGFNVVIDGDDVKARNIRRDPRASLALYDNDPPYRGLELRTKARLIREGAVATMTRIAIRYLGEEAARGYAESLDGGEVIVRLEPGDLRTWDFAEDF